MLGLIGYAEAQCPRPTLSIGRRFDVVLDHHENALRHVEVDYRRIHRCEVLESHDLPDLHHEGYALVSQAP